MAEQHLRLKNFAGGVSDDDKYGIENSSSEAQAIDFRKSPGKITLHRQLTKESGTLIDTEVHDAVRVDENGGDVYIAGGTKMYKRAPGANGGAGTYTLDSDNGNLKGVQDLDYRPDLDVLLLIDKRVIHEKSPMSLTPGYTYNKYKEFASNVQTGTGGSYALPATINEAQAWIFTLQREPIYSCTFTMVVKGTGNWTATLHDGANHVVGSKTINNASLPVSPGPVEFVFATPLRGKLDASYHVHITSHNGTGTIQTTSANTLPLAQASLKVERLVDTGSYGHATIQLGAKTYICNERYIAEWEILDTTNNATAGFDAHKLVFPAEVIAIGAAIYNEFIAFAGALKRSTDTIDGSPTEGKIFFWNGTTDFPEFALDVPQGAPNSLTSKDNVLYWEANGSWYRWAGGDIEIIYQFPGVDHFLGSPDGVRSELYLKAGRHVMASNLDDNTLLIGFPYATANMNTKIGLFSYGKSKAFMPLAIGYNAILSTGHDTAQFNTGPTPDVPITGITLVKRFGSNLIVGWKDMIDNVLTYGVDFVNDTKGAAHTGRYLSLLFDNGSLEKKKTALGIIATALTLPAGCSVIPIVEYDRSGTVEQLTEGTIAAGGTYTKADLHQKFREIRFGVDLTSTGAFPEVTSLALKFDDNADNTDETP